MSEFTNRELKYFDVAKAMAKTSKHPKFSVGAAIVCGGKVISVGVNMNKTHPMQKKYNKYRNIDKPMHHNLHAEMDAILQACNQFDDIKNLKVFVYRETKDGKRAMARPCAACMQALRDYGIYEIYYTTDTGLAYEVIKSKKGI